MAEAEKRAEVAEESMARLQQLQERRHASSAETEGNTGAAGEGQPDEETSAERSAVKVG